MEDMKMTDKIGKISLHELMTLVNHVVDARIGEYDRGKDETQENRMEDTVLMELEDIKERLNTLELHVDLDGGSMADTVIEAIRMRGILGEQ